MFVIMISKTDSERLQVCESTKRRRQKTNGKHREREIEKITAKKLNKIRVQEQKNLKYK
jgi:hypothetical protein